MCNYNFISFKIILKLGSTWDMDVRESKAGPRTERVNLLSLSHHCNANSNIHES